ncbi:transcriptional regulator [Nocardioides sp. BP30]|uniref:GAF domain-containing protein n=1 Tax=Nocardioides sp. BP30 TaxID=3036374 RepID=UPI0024698C25|nr:GAF domain-containing protein [Nocardioides sp. BP30]WGL50567.1 transcriptional regulator [Nocardioides sp. BP30]
MGDSGRAWTLGDDPRALARTLHAAHDDFLLTGAVPGRVRPLVAKSWLRSVTGGMDPETGLPPLDLLDSDLEAWRAGHPLAPVMSMIRRLLVEDAAEAGMLVAVSDEVGRLLWVEGASPLRSRAESIHFTAGAWWSESRAGTNAPGTALALDQPVQIFAWEHLARAVTPWSCTAAPIHDPDTGAILGCLDVTGGDEVAAPHALALVRSAVAAVEGELQRRRLTGVDGPDRSIAARAEGWSLRALGRTGATLRRSGRSARLSLRHSELVLLLALHAEGISGERLALALYEHDNAMVSLRAELSRLRPVLAPLGLESRPYRLSDPVDTDAALVRRHLAAGRLSEAVRSYPGPLLPQSAAPGIARLRQDLHDDVRSALLAGVDAEATLRFASSEHGLLDLPIWQHLERLLGPASPRRAQVAQHLAFLDRELGAP